MAVVVVFVVIVVVVVLRKSIVSTLFSFRKSVRLSVGPFVRNQFSFSAFQPKWGDCQRVNMYVFRKSLKLGENNEVIALNICFFLEKF